MESRIKDLQEKYWLGETSINEEQILKNHFQNKKPEGMESNYFTHLQKASTQRAPVEFTHPGKKIKMPNWIMAAAISAGLLAGAYFVKIYEDKNEFLVENPQEAMEITRQALMTISSGMNKGTAYVDNFKKIDDAKQKVKYKTEPAFNSGFFISNF